MRWTPNRVVALYLGLALFFLGLLGWFANPTLNEGSWTFYKLDLVMSLIHVGTGMLGLLAVFTGWSRLYNRACGIFYLLLGLVGVIPLFTFNNRLLGLTHANLALNLSHLLIGLAAIILGFFITTYGSWSKLAQAAL
ncbi:MAG: DUF4383 domain-containing protein [Ktedonobacteraceae bacterium]